MRPAMRRIEINLPASVRRAGWSAIVHSLLSGPVSTSLPRWTNLFSRGRRFGRRRGLDSLARKEFGKSRLFERLSFGFLLLDLIHVHQVRCNARFARRSFVTFCQDLLYGFHRIPEVADLESHAAESRGRLGLSFFDLHLRELLLKFIDLFFEFPLTQPGLPKVGLVGVLR